MSKVLVDRELLESLAELGEDAINRMGSYLAEKHGEQRYVDAARAILAQPAEAEGVEVVAWRTPSGCLYDSKEVAEKNVVTGHICKVESLMTVAQHQSILSAERTRADVAVADANDAERALAAVTAERDGLEGELEKLKHAPAQELLERLVAQLLECGAENYQESIFDLEIGSDVLTASVILRHLDKPGPHELRLKAEAERDQLRAEIEMLREDAERFRHIERDCDSGMRGIYGDDWVEVIDSYIAEYAAMAAKEE